jgi:hypothetical protein
MTRLGNVCAKTHVSGSNAKPLILLTITDMFMAPDLAHAPSVLRKMIKYC